MVFRTATEVKTANIAEHHHPEHSIEVVTPWSGKVEDIIVFATLALILITSSSLLHLLYPSEQGSTKVTPAVLRQSLVALSNAAEEISMLEDIMETRPNLEALVEMQLSPFSANPFDNMTELHWREESQCFIAKTVGITPAYLIKLHLLKNNPDRRYEISWRIAHDNTSFLMENCREQYNSDWQNVGNSKPAHKDLHGH